MPTPKPGHTPNYPFDGRRPFISQDFKWRVMWERGDDIYQKEFSCDLGSALAHYEKLKASGKRSNVTLVCANHGFPPPEHLTHREYEVIEERKVRGRMRRVRVKKTRNVMGQLNAKGIWWCPYCIKLRRFERRMGNESLELGVYVEFEGPRMCCPLCDATSMDFNVGQCNPQAAVIRAHNQVSRRRKKRRKRGRKSSTK
jgi:hypothetical protein